MAGTLENANTAERVRQMAHEALQGLSEHEIANSDAEVLYAVANAYEVHGRPTARELFAHRDKLSIPREGIRYDPTLEDCDVTGRKRYNPDTGKSEPDPLVDRIRREDGKGL